MYKHTLLFLSLLIGIPFYGQSTIRMQKENGVYVVPCKVNDLKLKFIFDTGASEVSISLTEALFMLKNGYLSKEDIIGRKYYSDATGDISVGTNIIIRKIEFAGNVIYNVEATVVNNISAPLLLGQSAMAKLGKFQFDPLNGTLIIINGNKSEEIYEVKGGKYYDCYGRISNYRNELYDYQREQEIIVDYTKSIEFNKPDEYYRTYFDRGETYMALGDYQGAIADFTKSIELEPEFYRAYYDRGNAKKALKDYQGAIVDYTKIIEFDSSEFRRVDILQAYYDRGDTYMALGDYQGAIVDYTKIIELEPKNYPANYHTYYYRCDAKYYLGDYLGAIADFTVYTLTIVGLYLSNHFKILGGIVFGIVCIIGLAYKMGGKEKTKKK